MCLRGMCLRGMCLRGMCLRGMCLCGMCLRGMCLCGMCLCGMCLCGMCLCGMCLRLEQLGQRKARQTQGADADKLPAGHAVTQLGPRPTQIQHARAPARMRVKLWE
jgi:hypothetical protein